MSSTPTPDRRTGVPASISAQLTVFFDGRFWVGVLEHHELRHGGDANSRAITVRAARHVFGAEPSDVELYDFLLTHGGILIDRAAASPPVPAPRSVDSSSTPRPNPKRAARQAAKEAARARPSTAAQPEPAPPSGGGRGLGSPSGAGQAPSSRPLTQERCSGNRGCEGCLAGVGVGAR